LLVPGEQSHRSPMPDISSDTHVATAYPPDQLYEAWEDHAEELDMSISQYLIRMVEAGRKQISVDEFAADSLRELRDQRDDLQNEVRRQRDRVEELEQQLNRTAQTDVLTYVEENPGATAPEIIQHVADTVPSRTVGLLDALDGRSLREEDGDYYAVNDQNMESGPDHTESEEDRR